MKFDKENREIIREMGKNRKIIREIARENIEIIREKGKSLEDREGQEKLRVNEEMDTRLEMVCVLMPRFL